MDATRLEWISACDAARAIREGTIRSEQLVEACLARTRVVEPAVQAWHYLDPGYALAQARSRDSERRLGQPLGALHGVPIGLKDISRHGRHADRERHRVARRTNARCGRVSGLDAARGGCGDHGHDGDHRVRDVPARQDPQPAPSAAHARRLVVWLRGGGCGIDTLEQIPHLMRQAFREATTGTPRPVHLDMAGYTGDAVTALEGAFDLVADDAHTRFPAFRPAPDPAIIDKATGSKLRLAP